MDSRLRSPRSTSGPGQSAMVVQGFPSTQRLLGEELKMLVVYVSGKYRDARGPWYVKKNIELAGDVAIEVWKLGFCAICPHMNTALMEGPLDDPHIIAGDCELVRRSDAVVVLPNWETSEGTRIEVKTALENNKPVFFWDNPTDRAGLKHWAQGSYDIDGHMRQQREYKDLASLAAAFA